MLRELREDVLETDDSDGDGEVDTYLVDTTGDGKTDSIYLDTDGNGAVDTIIEDITSIVITTTSWCKSDSCLPPRISSQMNGSPRVNHSINIINQI